MAELAPWSPFGATTARLPAERPGVTLLALEPPAAYLLQGDPSDVRWRDAVEGVVGAAPPQDVGAVARAAGRRIAALGPDMWLLIADKALSPEAQAELGVGFAHVGVVDQSEARCWLRLEGPAAALTLAKLTTLDLRDTAFAVGRAQGARLGPIAGLIERDGRDGFNVAGPVSTAEFLAEMLLDALPASD